jgi:hypothetical protein
MSFAYAGTYGPFALQTATGRLLPNTLVTVYEHGTLTAQTLYSDRTMDAVLPNPTLTDNLGNLLIFTTPGQVDIVADGIVQTLMVYPDPEDVYNISGGSNISSSGGTFTGPIRLEASSGTTVAETVQLSGDAYPRQVTLGNASTQITSPLVPTSWGTHVSGDVGSGSDFLWGMEGISDVAFMMYQGFPKLHMTDGVHELFLTTPATFPLSGSPTLLVSSTTGLASSGTLNAGGVYWGSGTITYTSIIDGTHLGGCTSTGLASTADTSLRFAYILFDSYGASIIWWGDYAGVFINDQINFAYDGVFPSNEFDIITGFFDDINRNTGSGIMLGYDRNVILQRIQDGFGNNEFLVTVDTHILTWDLNGLYPNTALNLGVPSAPWGIASLHGTNTSPGTAVSTPTFANGTATQLAQTTTNATVYLTVGTAGTAMTVKIGPTSTPGYTVVSSSPATAGQLYSIPLPAGWYLKWSATTATIANQLAVTC